MMHVARQPYFLSLSGYYWNCNTARSTFSPMLYSIVSWASSHIIKMIRSLRINGTERSHMKLDRTGTGTRERRKIDNSRYFDRFRIYSKICNIKFSTCIYILADAPTIVTNGAHSNQVYHIICWPIVSFAPLELFTACTALCTFIAMILMRHNRLFCNLFKPVSTLHL